jgi:hypothetical protein
VAWVLASERRTFGDVFRRNGQAGVNRLREGMRDIVELATDDVLGGWSSGFFSLSGMQVVALFPFQFNAKMPLTVYEVGESWE